MSFQTLASGLCEVDSGLLKSSSVCFIQESFWLMDLSLLLILWNSLVLFYCTNFMYSTLFLFKCFMNTILIQYNCSNKALILHNYIKVTQNIMLQNWWKVLDCPKTFNLFWNMLFPMTSFSFCCFFPVTVWHISAVQAIWQSFASSMLYEEEEYIFCQENELIQKHCVVSLHAKKTHLVSLVFRN